MFRNESHISYISGDICEYLRACVTSSKHRREGVILGQQESSWPTENTHTLELSCYGGTLYPVEMDHCKL